MPSTLPCGTEAAYQRHIYHAEQPCDLCAANHRRYGQTIRDALSALAGEYPSEYAAIRPRRENRAAALAELRVDHAERFAALWAQARESAGTR